MPRVRVDPSSPIPLYHQIAEVIRTRIESGQLAPGDALHPLRVAAEEWGVNLHTVRHAYAALARAGFLEIGRGSVGTRVARRRRRGVRRARAGAGEAAATDLATFLDEWMREARRRFGIDRAAVIAALGDTRPPAAYVTECSEHQCTTHAREIMEQFAVDARPWPLTRGEPPPGPVIATYFHYNDIRRRWPRRLDTTRFVTIRPDPALRGRLHGFSGRIRVCERDAETAEAVIGDLDALLGPTRIKFVATVTRTPAAALRGAGSSPVIFPPRIWAALGARARADRRSIELVYVFDAQEFELTATELGWSPRSAGAVACGA